MRAISATSRSVECLKIKGKNFKDKEQKVNTTANNLDVQLYIFIIGIRWYMKVEIETRNR